VCIEVITKWRTKYAVQKGEVYKCPDEGCGYEVTVTKGTPASCGGTQNPPCCCGKTMV
tara:strand:+ start:419 stop:592 length:174 start_codon:yes stop_codon:yes gene_type:complete